MKYDMGHAKFLKLTKGAVPSIYPEGSCRSVAKGTDQRRDPTPRLTSAMRKREALQVVNTADTSDYATCVEHG